MPSSTSSFVFDPLLYVGAGYEQSAGDFTAQIRAYLMLLRTACPELSHWGDLALYIAWGSYSEDVEMVSFINSVPTSRRDDFLNYLCWQQTRTDWIRGDDSRKLTEANEWRN